MSDSLKIIGVAEVGPRRPIGLAVADARFHIHIPGATGCGKSTLIANLALQDVAAGRGVIVVDPKGDLVRDLLDRLPASAVGRLVLIDPDETEAPPALNVLDGENPALVVDQVVGIFQRVFHSYWGPRTEDILRCTCITLVRLKGTTLADIPRLLTDSDFRGSLIDQTSGDSLRNFWSWYESLTPTGQANAIGPVLSKLRAVLSRQFVADLFGTTSSSFDMSAVLDGGILLARLPKGILGDETARLVGSVLVARAWHAATRRATLHERQRRDAALYIDECHNFLNIPGAIEDVLAEARGYRLSLVLAHQHLDQLPRELAAAISANARNKICFTVSPEDAIKIGRHLGPVLTPYDLSHLGRYQIALRLLADDEEAPAFTLRTLPLPRPIPARSGDLRASAREAFGRTRKQRHAEATQRRLTQGRRFDRRPDRHFPRHLRSVDPLPEESPARDGYGQGPESSDSWDES